ncbi:MAG TPA: hypothetical protein VMK65_08780 [Longimicrobiales bacterium]|nr:hypothetical protein [Longimicrobiales bacterium]
MRAALLALAFLFAAAAADAQVRDCELVRSVSVSGSEVTGGSVQQIEGPLTFRCSGGLTIDADQGIRFEPQAERRFIGNVVLRDSAQLLTTDYMTVFGREERLLARGSVVFTDLTTGSVITGYEMERFARTFPAGEERTVVRGRPHAVLQRGPGEAAAEPAPPLIVDSDSMVIRGREHFRALGAVALRRGELHGVGTEAVYDGEAGLLELVGAGASGRPGALPRATLDAETFDLAADRVVAELAGEEIRHLTATGEAVLTSEQASVQGPRLDLFFTDGALDRLVGVVRAAQAAAPEEAPVAEAVVEEPAPEELPLPRRSVRAAAPVRTEAARPGPEAGEAEEERPRVRAVAEGLRMVSDSLEILAPGEVIDQVTAVGDAFAERLPAGEADAETLPDIIARDWIRGDTIVGWFADAPAPAPADTAQRVLERLLAVGGARRPATSLHRMQGEGAGQDVSYLAARRITLLLVAGEVSDVQAEGPVKGLYLTREQRPQAVDTAAVSPPDTVPGPGALGPAEEVGASSSPASRTGTSRRLAPPARGEP